MWKRLVILIGLAVVMIGAIVFVTCKNERSAEDYQQKSINNSHPAAISPAHENDRPNQTQDSDPKPACWHILLAWPNGITAWAIIFTLIAIGWQSYETRRSVIVAEKSAEDARNSAADATMTAQATLNAIERQVINLRRQVIWSKISARATNLSAKTAVISSKAALLNTQAVINAERAWIVIQVESPALNTFRFRAVNVGKTPAKVISIHGRWIAVNRHNELQMPPDDEMNISLISTPPCFLPPTVSCTAFECNITDVHGKVSVEEWMNHLRLGLFEIFFYGKIRYYDVLDADPKVLHETKWLYWLPPFENALPIPDPKRPEDNAYE